MAHRTDASAAPPAATADVLPDFSGLRVLVVHDWMLAWAGAERVLAEIVNVVPHADVVVGALAPRLRDANRVTRMVRETWLARLPGGHGDHRWLLPVQYAAFAGLRADDYDLVISSASAFCKAVRPRVGVPHVCYCHSPPRYLWDMSDVYRRQMSRAQALALGAAAPILRVADRRSARRVTQFVSNSRFVAERIRRVYGREAIVVSPPVQAKHVDGRRNGGREDFLLVLGRLVQYKRVDLAIRAAEEIGMPLVIAGDGPDRSSLEALAGPRTTFLGEVDETTAGNLLERCRAFVFCAEEDFGIAPVEANAHGAPVVAFGRGALPESMTGDTAVFFQEQTVEAVSQAIRAALARSWNEEKLRSNARRFGPGRFRREFAAVLQRAISGASR